MRFSTPPAAAKVACGHDLGGEPNAKPRSPFCLFVDYP